MYNTRSGISANVLSDIRSRYRKSMCLGPLADGLVSSGQRRLPPVEPDGRQVDRKQSLVLTMLLHKLIGTFLNVLVVTIDKTEPENLKTT